MTTPGGRPMSVADLIAMGPMGGGGAAPAADDLPKPIGIPKTFRPPGRPMGRPGALDSSGRPARQFVADPREPYYDGSEAAPSVLSPEKRARLQTALAQAGLIGKNDVFRLGVWDETSRKAYRQVLEHANYRGIDADTALQELLSAPAYKGDGTQAGGAGGSGGGGALQVEPGRVTATTNRLSLEDQVQATAQERLGRKLRKNEVSKFVSLYQGMEKGFNSKTAKMQDTAAETGQDFQVEEMVSPDAGANQYVEANFAQEAAGESAYDYLGALRNLIGG